VRRRRRRRRFSVGQVLVLNNPPASRCHSTLVALTLLSSLVSAATLLLRSCPTALFFSAEQGH